LPAFGRQLKAAIEAGLRPRTGGGGVIVTSEWNYALAFAPGRVVCPPDCDAEAYDFEFLCGLDVLVLVRERDRHFGEALRDRIRASGARVAILLAVRENAL
jgi:hypothetical protein